MGLSFVSPLFVGESCSIEGDGRDKCADFVRKC